MLYCAIRCYIKLYSVIERQIYMDEVRNPFAPGAGNRPPELSGRNDLIHNADVAIQRLAQGRSARSTILFGLRGVGKTVLLGKFETIAESLGCKTSFIEAPDNKSLADLLYPQINQVLRQLSSIEAAKTHVYSALGALRSFASVFKVSVGEASIFVDPAPGIADSGFLENDLSDLFIQIGMAAQAAKQPWVLLIDEVQYLSKEDLSALIVAIHHINQKSLPILFFGAGLPQIGGLSGNAKSYAERLFDFCNVGALDFSASCHAIRQPIENEGESISDAALQVIFEKTLGYPYFLQEWGSHVWNIAEQSPIDEKNIKDATAIALRRLDESFFKVRFDRLTPKERDYVFAMARLEKGPYRSAEVAKSFGESVQQLATLRANIIHKGMIYSPEHGDIDFTVPLFSDFLRRIKKDLQKDMFATLDPS